MVQLHCQSVISTTWPIRDTFSACIFHLQISAYNYCVRVRSNSKREYWFFPLSTRQCCIGSKCKAPTQELCRCHICKSCKKVAHSQVVYCSIYDKKNASLICVLCAGLGKGDGHKIAGCKYEQSVMVYSFIQLNDALLYTCITETDNNAKFNYIHRQGRFWLYLWLYA